MCGAAAMARDDVVERQVVRLRAAVLAGVLVTDEDLAPRQPDPRPGALDVVLQPDDATARGRPRGRGPDVVVVVLDHLCLLAEDRRNARLTSQTLRGS